MNIYELLDSFKNMKGNYCIGSLYISLENMEIFINELQNLDIELSSILITPFLIDVKQNKVYELHYYEFLIEISHVLFPVYMEYSQKNLLPKEVLENLKPKVYVPKGDKESFVYVFRNYIAVMKKMHLDDETIIKSWSNHLFFQLY